MSTALLYLPPTAWVCTWIGLRARTRLRAIVAALVVLAVWNGLPPLVYQMVPEPELEWLHLLSPAAVITMIEELLYDTTHLAEALSMPLQVFNQMLTMPLPERYQIGLQMAKETVAELEQAHAAGDPFPEHFRPNGYDH